MFAQYIEWKFVMIKLERNWSWINLPWEMNEEQNSMKNQQQKKLIKIE